MPIRVKLLIAALLVAGAGVFVIAAMIGDSSRSDVSVSGSEAIDELIPARQGQVLQQQRVGIDLSADFELTSLLIFPNNQFTGGVEVIGQVIRTDGLNQFIFAPREGQIIEALAPDTNCVIATYRRISRPDDIDSIDWCFAVV